MKLEKKLKKEKNPKLLHKSKKVKDNDRRKTNISNNTYSNGF